MEAWQRDWDELLAGVTHSGPPVSSQLSPRHTWKDRGRPPFWELTDGRQEHTLYFPAAHPLLCKKVFVLRFKNIFV